MAAGHVMRSSCSALLIGLALTACSDSQGPDLAGPPFFEIAVDGDSVPVVAEAGCGDYGLIVMAASLDPPIPYAHVLEVHVANVRQPATFELAGRSSGSFAFTRYLTVVGLSYQTDSLHPGRFTVSGLDFADSVVAGSFSFRLVSLLSATTTYDVTGSFRLPFHPVFTQNHPEGTPCQAPPN
jgi:hypothetical protein